MTIPDASYEERFYLLRGRVLQLRRLAAVAYSGYELATTQQRIDTAEHDALAKLDADFPTIKPLIRRW